MEPCAARSSGRSSCSHFLAEAGVARVVIACMDPSPFASGRGGERLRQVGLTVETGLLHDEAAVLYEGYLHRLETGRPMVRVSPDGAGFDARFAASPRADLVTELKRLGEAGYTRLWTAPGDLADALADQGLLTAGRGRKHLFPKTFLKALQPMVASMAALKDEIQRRRISQAELDAICARHDRLWQAKPGGARAVLAWMDLSGLDLRGRNLADADFAAANLIGCDLTGARLDNAAFFGADMQDAILVDASLRRAGLRGACLRGADLSGADLFEADLREGTLAAADRKTGFRVMESQSRADTQAQGACLAGANLQRSRLSGVAAQCADFSDAIMKDCKLVRANLKQANFRGADLAGADLSGADLAGADLRDAILVGVKSAMWRTDGANLDGALTDDRSAGSPVARMPAANMLHEHAVWCESGGAEGQPSVFDGVDLRGLGSITGLNLTALSAKRAVFYGLDMEGVQLQGAHLEGADLRSTNLRRADLRGARLVGARLGGADLRDAQLGPLLLGPERLLAADLSGASLRGADLTGADLRRAVFAGADLCRASLHGAQARLADFTGAILTGVRGLDAEEPSA